MESWRYRRRLKPAQGKQPRWDPFQLSERDGTKHIAYPHSDLPGLRLKYSKRKTRARPPTTTQLHWLQTIPRPWSTYSTSSFDVPCDQQHSFRKRRQCESQLKTTVLVPKSETRGFDSWLTSSLRIECNFPLATSDIQMYRLYSSLNKKGNQM